MIYVYFINIINCKGICILIMNSVLSLYYRPDGLGFLSALVHGGHNMLVVTISALIEALQNVFLI